MNRIYCKLVHVVDGQMDEAINLLDQEVKGQPMPPPTADHCSLPAFRRLSEADVRRLVMSSEIKSITPDPVPTFLLREFVDVLPPYVTCVVKSSLRQGRLPDSQKHAVVTPLLKRPGLDTANMANYRPVSNVTFMSKIVERAVSQQLHQYLADNDLLPRYQSAYRRHHSTETAMLRVLSDVLTAADAQQVTLLGGFVSSVRLRRSPASAAATSTSTRLWIYRDSACMDDVVCHRQNSTSAIQGLPFSCLTCPVRGPTGICPWPHTVCLVYGKKSAESLLSTGSSSTSMPTTAKFTAPRQ